MKRRGKERWGIRERDGKIKKPKTNRRNKEIREKEKEEESKRLKNERNCQEKVTRENNKE